jgi:hypothetical protein
MLRVPIGQAKPGMKLAMPVFHPRTHDTLLLKAGIELDERSIARLREMGLPEVWIRYPKLDYLGQYVHPRVMAARASVTRHIADAFNIAGESMHANLDFSRYRHAIMGLLEVLCDTPLSRVFVGDLVEAGQPAVRHATNTAYIAVLIGLRLDFYLERERKRLPAALARDVTNLGVAAMLHDIGLSRVPRDVLMHYAHTGDDADPAFREHCRIGYEMLRGDVEPTAAAAVLHHHQRFDGTGYPTVDRPGQDLRPLIAREIHVFSRIIAAADLFDQLVHPAHTPGSDEIGLVDIPPVRALRLMQTKPYCDWIDPVVFSGLLEVCPPYAPGTRVRLTDGREGVVANWSPKDPCRPTVAIVAAWPEDVGEDVEPVGMLDLRLAPGVQIEEAHGQRVLDDNFYAENRRIPEVEAIERAASRLSA